MTSTETSVMGIATEIYAKYSKTTTKKMKLIDAFLAYVLTTGIIQFLYCVLVGTFPFNSFLSGFICTVGVFVLTVSLRMQINAENKDFKDLSPERAFADYLLCNFTLFLVVMNFIG